MKDSWRYIMSNVARLTQSGRLREATAAIQRALGVRPMAQPEQQTETAHPPRPAADFRGAAAATPTDRDATVIDVEARVIVEKTPPAHTPEAFVPPEVEPVSPLDVPEHEPAERPRVEPGFGAADIGPGTGRFIDGCFTNAAGTRPYKVYVPGGHAKAGKMPLVVMLHGCKQNPEDFAAGTRMNELAQAQGWVVLYPGQERAANPMGCWNWFQETDQQRGVGEPSILADMTREVIAKHAIDPRRVYVAGLSAGGAMAAIMAMNYPELYAAAGIHSGLPHAAANDVASAFRAMRKGPRSRESEPIPRSRRSVPTIVFHGDRDTTVHPDNGHEVIAQARASSSRATAANGPDTLRGEILGGHRFTRTLHRDARGRPDAEHWVIHGSGHAWSGGSAKGSYTDPQGPDASREMLRFFAEHPMGEEDRSGPR